MNSTDAATNSDLLAAARGGSSEAIEMLLTRQQERIYRFAMTICGDPEDAKDVLQETMLAMARALPEFRGAAALPTWIYAIARNCCARARRKSKYAPDTLESLDTVREVAASDGCATRPDEIAESRETREVLSEAIEALQPEYQDVLVLRDVEGLKAAEVADILDLSVSAVKSRLHRARKQVRDRLHPVLAAAPSSPDCPDVVMLYSEYVEGDISADLCAEMQKHLAECERCELACNSLKHALSLCQSVPCVTVPGPVQASVRDALRDFFNPQ